VTGAVVVWIIFAVAAATTMILLRLPVVRRGRAKMSLQRIVRVHPVR